MVPVVSGELRKLADRGRAVGTCAARRRPGRPRCGGDRIDRALDNSGQGGQLVVPVVSGELRKLADGGKPSALAPLADDLASLTAGAIALIVSWTIAGKEGDSWSLASSVAGRLNNSVMYNLILKNELAQEVANCAASILDSASVQDIKYDLQSRLGNHASLE